jgi:hypothetical protein
VAWWFRREHKGWSDKEVKCLTPPLTKKKHLAFCHFKLGEGLFNGEITKHLIITNFTLTKLKVDCDMWQHQRPRIKSNRKL